MFTYAGISDRQPPFVGILFRMDLGAELPHSCTCYESYSEFQCHSPPSTLTVRFIQQDTLIAARLIPYRLQVDSTSNPFLTYLQRSTCASTPANKTQLQSLKGDRDNAQHEGMPNQR